MKSDEIDLSSEIILNFLNNNIKTDVKSLKRLKKCLNVLTKKSKSYIFKRQLLPLQIINVLLLLVSIILNIIN